MNRFGPKPTSGLPVHTNWVVQSAMGFPNGSVEPIFRNLSSGQTVSTVLELLVFNPGCHVCRSLLHKQVFVTDIQLQKGAVFHTVLNGKINNAGEKIWILSQEATMTFVRPQFDMQGLFRMVEACSGVAAVSQGYAQCKATTVCTVESNPVFHEWNVTKTSTPCILGNIADAKTVAAVAAQAPFSHTLSAGISRQPFSHLGDMKEQHDSRSDSCPGAILMGYWLGSLMTILECTPQAHQSAWVQTMLKEFSEETHCKVFQTVLSLHTVWPSKRDRWWCIIAHPALELRDIPDMPSFRFEPGVLHLMCQMLQLNDDPLSQLLLDPYELEQFNAVRGGIQSSFLDRCKTCPTATHSWGSQLRACMCGCRAKGFHPARLAERGLYGRLVPIPGSQRILGHDVQMARHLHPAEIALLNGMQPAILSQNPVKPLRLDLAGVGQMGSPIQSAWILGNLLFQLTQQGLLNFDLHPRQILENLCQDLLRSRDTLFPNLEHTKYMDIFATEICSLASPMTFKPNPLDSDDEGLTHEIALALDNLDDDVPPPAEKELPISATPGFALGIVPGFASAPTTFAAQPQETMMFRANILSLKQETNVSLTEEPDIMRIPEPVVPSVRQASRSRSRSRDKFFTPPLTFEPAKIPTAIASPVPGDGFQAPGFAAEHDDTASTEAEDPDLAAYVIYSHGHGMDVTFTPGATVAQLIEAEGQLNPGQNPQVVTSFLGMPLPEAQPLHPDMALMLHDGPVPPALSGTNRPSPPILKGATRAELLWKQQGWVAVDEMEFYLHMV